MSSKVRGAAVSGSRGSYSNFVKLGVRGVSNNLVTRTTEPGLTELFSNDLELHSKRAKVKTTLEMSEDENHTRKE